MIDMPSLKQAQNVVALSAAVQKNPDVWAEKGGNHRDEDASRNGLSLTTTYKYSRSRSFLNTWFLLFKLIKKTCYNFKEELDFPLWRPDHVLRRRIYPLQPGRFHRLPLSELWWMLFPQQATLRAEG